MLKSTSNRKFFMRAGRWSAIVVATVFLSLTASSSDAAFIAFDGNNPEPDEQNVLLENDSVGMTISGNTNQTNTGVTFTSPSQFLAAPSNGQAVVEARELNDIDSDQVAIDDSITVALADPSLRFRDLIFNTAIVGGRGSGGSLTFVIVGVNADNTPAGATLTVDDDGDDLLISNGSNFFTILATEGMLMTSVEIQTNADTSYADLRQIRISGIIPEPASAVMLMFFAAALCGVRQFRK